MLNLHEIPELPKRQDSLSDQLEDLRLVANKLGMYDASDVLATILSGSSSPPPAPGLDQYHWLAGWYASRLHAVPKETELPRNQQDAIQARCGAWVYKCPPPKAAQDRVNRGKVPRCKICEKSAKSGA